MSPFFVKKHGFFLQKHVFLTKKGLINSGFMSVKQLIKERQPLAVVLGYYQNHETSGNILVPLLGQE
jgi:Icc-related predicted phosphoesterase